MKKEALLFLVLLMTVWFLLEADHLKRFGESVDKPLLGPSQEDLEEACVALCDDCVVYEESELPVRFLGRIARTDRTVMPDFENYGGVVDSPGVSGSDNPSIFYDRGKLYMIFGDPNLFLSSDVCSVSERQLSGAMAFTEEIVPQKGLSFEHNRNWVKKEIGSSGWDCDENGFPDAKALSESISEGGHSYYRPNNIGGVVLDLPGGDQRIVFMTYFRESSASDENRVQMLYTDDDFETLAIRDPDLILWDKYDEGNGPNVPNTFLGYSMRKYGDYVYMHFPGGYSRINLLRIHLDDLTKEEMLLDDWEYLVSVDETTGEATWNRGITRGQISQNIANEMYIPQVDFDPVASIVASIIWNPYLNRWLVSDVIRDYMWVAEDYWGPYRLIRSVETPGSYNRFMHETLLGDNGRDVYYAAAQYPQQRYGTYFYVADFGEPFDIFLSQKSAMEGDNIEIKVVDNLGGGGPMEAFVDGNPVELVSSEDNEYLFSYTLSGEENLGEEGVVKVLATNSTYSRDVALVVNRINEIDLDITSHVDGDVVSGTIFLDVDAHYEQEPLDLGEGKPEVYIIKTELSSECGFVEDADTYEPYSLKLDTTRFSNGNHYFKVIAYDTLDRRAEKIILLNVSGPQKSEMEKDLVIDGDMEFLNISSWETFNGAEVKKVQGVQKSGALGLLVVNDQTIDSAKGVEQTVTGLEGGEELRLEAWIKIIPYIASGDILYSDAFVSVIDKSGQAIASGDIDPYGYFRRFTYEFTNPADNDELTLRFTVKESNTAGAEKVEMILDDVALVDASVPVVESPEALEGILIGSENYLSWNLSASAHSDYFYIYKKNASDLDYEKIDEVRYYQTNYLDENHALEENVTYHVTLVDLMGSESLPSVEIGCPENCTVCGDGICEGIEDLSNCQDDCAITIAAPPEDNPPESPGE
ncbi:MAG: hypothetical protein ABH864_03580 [archaeon]